MKKLIILSLILAAGLTAYPQSSRSSREVKSNKGNSSQVATKSSSRSGSSQVKKSSSNQNSSREAVSRSSGSRSTAVQSGSSSRSTQQRAVQSGSSSRSTQQRAVQSNSAGSRSGAVKSGNNQIIQSGSSRPAVPSKISTSERGRSQSAVSRSVNENGNRSARETTGSSVSRSNRQGSNAYVSNDGREYRHQNDEVFKRDRYRIDYRDAESLRRSPDFIRVHNHYYNWYSRRHVRNVVVHHHYYRPLSIEIRRVRYPYRAPVHLDLCWTPYMHNRFIYYYPLRNNWNIRYGEYIETASSYEAANYAGTVRRVYGKVEEVYYAPEDRTYTLYFGAPFPYHDFSVVIPRDVAKSFNWSPSWYFEDEHVWVVGLIEMWEGKPEIVLHDEEQIRRY